MPKKKETDELIRQIKEDALQRSKSMERRPIPKPLPLAPSELWPNESLDPDNPGRFLLASRKRKARRRAIGMA